MRAAQALAAALALALGVSVLASCDGASSRAAARAGPPATTHAAAAPRLAWHEGQRVDVDVRVQQTDLASTADRTVPMALAVHPTQSLQVTSVRGGTATLRVETMSWTWLESQSELAAGSPPGPFQLQVDSKGELTSGEYWSLPNHPRPPGIDLFSAGLPDHHVRQGERWGATWHRTRRDDLPLAYHVSSLAAEATSSTLTVDSRLDWDLSQISNTANGAVERLQGTGHGDVRSLYDTTRGQLNRTCYTVTYDTTDTTDGSAVHTQGSFRAELAFRYR